MEEPLKAIDQVSSTAIDLAMRNAALRVVEETLRANSRVLQDPKPVIGVARLADSKVAIAVKPWVNVPDYAPAGAEVSKAILEAFRSRDIAFPVPQREVRMLPA